MKKFISTLTTLFLLVSICIPVFATTTGNIIIKNDPATTGISILADNYGAYRILETLTNKQYKVDSDYTEFFNSKVTTEDVSTEEKFNRFAVNYLADHANINELAKELRDYTITKKIVADGKNGEVTVSADKKQSSTITDLTHGYYIIFDTKTLNSTVVSAAALGTINSDLEISLKASAPEITKEIKHNDGDWGIVGDNQIGDKVEYRIISKIPSTVQGYSKYKYIIHDALDKGLTFNKDIKIFVGDRDNGGVELTEYFTLPDVTDGHTFDIEVDILGGLLKPDGFKYSDELYIYYSATLNEDALVVSDHNDNKAYLEYSNNPYDEDSTDNTVEVIVKDYTFKLAIIKTSEDAKTPLEGAKFTISKNGVNLKFIKNIINPGTVNEVNQYVVYTGLKTETPTEELISCSTGKIEIIGLDDAIEYTLTEIEAPNGYYPIDPITFKIKAGYDENGNIISLETDKDFIKTNGSNYVLGTTIVNTTVNELPETGGIGTSIFMIVGGTMMVATIGLLLAKRRKKTS